MLALFISEGLTEEETQQAIASVRECFLSQTQETELDEHELENVAGARIISPFPQWRVKILNVIIAGKVADAAKKLLSLV